MQVSPPMEAAACRISGWPAGGGHLPGCVMQMWVFSTCPNRVRSTPHPFYFNNFTSRYSEHFSSMILINVHKFRSINYYSIGIMCYVCIWPLRGPGYHPISLKNYCWPGPLLSPSIWTRIMKANSIGRCIYTYSWLFRHQPKIKEKNNWHRVISSFFLTFSAEYTLGHTMYSKSQLPVQVNNNRWHNA
jgi:hypothetical protein